MSRALKKVRILEREQLGELHKPSPPAPVGRQDETADDSSTSLRDAALAERVERTLKQKDFRFSRCIRCTCERGVLVLIGCVPTYYLKQLAQVAAARVDGVQQIENHLDVFLPETSPRDRRPEGTAGK